MNRNWCDNIKEKKYNLFDILWDDEDVESVTNVIKRGSFWADGPEIREFENQLSKYLNCKYVVTFNSGTSALQAVLLAYDVTSGEVIVPSLSFISTANCVLLAGAKPVFAEIETETLGLDPIAVENKITKKTKAILPVHYGGKVCKNIETLAEISEDHNLTLLEDNAESFGAKINNKFAGTIGNAGMLSFCQNKIITTGEGGAICTDNVKIYEKLLLIRSHGRVQQPGENYFTNINEMDYIQIGYNFRMPSMCAALGIAQIKKIDKIIELRRQKGHYYDDHLKDIPQIQIIPELKGQRTVYQLYSILLNNPKKRDELQKYLLENGIYTKVYFYPIHLKSFYKKKFRYNEGDIPITESISSKLLTLPFSFKFTEEDHKFIFNRIKEFFNL